MKTYTMKTYTICIVGSEHAGLGWRENQVLDYRQEQFTSKRAAEQFARKLMREIDAAPNRAALSFTVRR